MPVNKNITIGSYKKISSKNPSKIPPNKPLPKTSVKKINWPVLKYKEKGEKIRKEDLKRIGKAFKEYIENLEKVGNQFTNYVKDYLCLDSLKKKCDKLINGKISKKRDLVGVADNSSNPRDCIMGLVQGSMRLPLVLKEVEKTFRKFRSGYCSSNAGKIVPNDIVQFTYYLHENDTKSYTEFAEKLSNPIDEFRCSLCGKTSKLNIKKFDDADIDCFYGFVHKFSIFLENSDLFAESVNKSGIPSVTEDLRCFEKNFEKIEELEKIEKIKKEIIEILHDLKEFDLTKKYEAFERNFEKTPLKESFKKFKEMVKDAKNKFSKMKSGKIFVKGKKLDKNSEKICNNIIQRAEKKVKEIEKDIKSLK